MIIFRENQALSRRLSCGYSRSMRHAYARLKAMKQNPRDDWTIRDLVSLCRTFGLDCRAPTHGSHYTVSYSKVEGILTVPGDRRIKPIYVMLFVQLIESVW